MICLFLVLFKCPAGFISSSEEELQRCWRFFSRKRLMFGGTNFITEGSFISASAPMLVSALPTVSSDTFRPRLRRDVPAVQVFFPILVVEVKGQRCVRGQSFIVLPSFCAATSGTGWASPRLSP